MANSQQSGNISYAPELVGPATQQERYGFTGSQEERERIAAMTDESPAQKAGQQALAKAAADRRNQLLSGDYSQADKRNPVLYSGGSYSGESSLRKATENDLNRFNEGKGYAVYDSFTDADGVQYVAVAGKNSGFIEKINTDGTIERIDNVSRRRDKKIYKYNKSSWCF